MVPPTYNNHLPLLKFWKEEDHSDYVEIQQTTCYSLDQQFFIIQNQIIGVANLVKNFINLPGIEWCGMAAHVVSYTGYIIHMTLDYMEQTETTFCDLHHVEWGHLADLLQECLDAVSNDYIDFCDQEIEETDCQWGTDISRFVLDELPAYAKSRKRMYEHDIIKTASKLGEVCFPLSRFTQEDQKRLMSMQRSVSNSMRKHAEDIYKLLCIQLVRLHHIALCLCPKTKGEIMYGAVSGESDKILEQFADDYALYQGDLTMGGAIESDYLRKLDYDSREKNAEETTEFFKEQLRIQESKMEKLLGSIGLKYHGDLSDTVIAIYSSFNYSNDEQGFYPEDLVMNDVNDADVTPFQICLVAYMGIRQRIEILREKIAVLESSTQNKAVKTFADYILDKDSKESLLQNFHILIDERKGKGVAIVIEAAVKYSLISKPPFSVLEKEFPNIGSKTAFNNYFEKDKFTDEELARYYKILKA